MTDRLTDMPQWQRLQRHSDEIRLLHLRELFQKDPDRAKRFTICDCGLLVDYSKNRITAETMRLLVELAEAAGLKDAIERMFRGEKINITENRAVLHVALRNRSGEASMSMAAT
jgi:glucose-6-phosphate isomerase